LPDNSVEVLPDVWDSYRVFAAMQTQWRIGASGAIGLDYSVLNQVIEFLGIESDKATIFSDLRVMEAKALEIMHKS